VKPGSTAPPVGAPDELYGEADATQAHGDARFVVVRVTQALEAAS
jgi:hypothetical protein